MYDVLVYYRTGVIEQCMVDTLEGVRWVKQLVKDAGFPAKIGVLKTTTKVEVIEKAAEWT